MAAPTPRCGGERSRPGFARGANRASLHENGGRHAHRLQRYGRRTDRPGLRVRIPVQHRCRRGRAVHAAFRRRLASFTRLILFDGRGTGLHGPVGSVRSGRFRRARGRMDDIRAVMDAIGSERALLLAVSDGGMVSVLFAASHAVLEAGGGQGGASGPRRPRWRGRHEDRRGRGSTGRKPTDQCHGHAAELNPKRRRAPGAASHRMARRRPSRPRGQQGTSSFPG
jgi:pimeloyl-ACP methyl ester carboxylesterase